MPILAVDEMGQIYVTSPDREDGRGIKEYPQQIGYADNTLGNAYLKSQAAQAEFVMKENRSKAIMAARDQAYFQKMKREQKAKRTAEALELINQANNETYQKNLLKKALTMGCTCEHTQGLSGNAFSSNGMMGADGWSRDARTIHHALNPHLYPKDTSHDVEHSEKVQDQMKRDAYEILRQRSRGTSY